MSTQYWYAPAMMQPWWYVVTTDDGRVAANNAEADTDMGILYGNEFHTYFPHAFQVSEEEFNNKTLRVDGKGFE